jgi:CxxC motif-containing protein
MYDQFDKREFVCIVCPVGCHLKVDFTEEGEVSVTGNKCPRGETYAREEVLAPKRTVTATAGVRGRLHRRVPVKTDAPLPVEHIDELLEAVYALDLQPPVQLGDVLIEDFSGTGVNLVATRSVEE